MSFLSKLFKAGATPPHKKKSLFTSTPDDLKSIILKRLAPHITTVEIARQFVLEELDAARHGDASAKQFVSECGLTEADYAGALSRPLETDQEKVAAAQSTFRTYTYMILDAKERTIVSLGVVDGIMEIWGMGKYSSSL